MKNRTRAAFVKAAGSSSLGFAVLLAVSLLQGLYAPVLADEFPKQIAGLRLLSKAEGDEAKRQIYSLHGKDLGLYQGFVLRYGNPARASSAAIIWISRSEKESGAEELMGRMVKGIRAGAGPYGHFKEIEVKGVHVISLYGARRRHFIYRMYTDVVWIETDYGIAEKFLDDALEKLKQRI